MIFEVFTTKHDFFEDWRAAVVWPVKINFKITLAMFVMQRAEEIPLLISHCLCFFFFLDISDFQSQYLNYPTHVVYQDVLIIFPPRHDVSPVQFCTNF